MKKKYKYDDPKVDKVEDPAVEYIRKTPAESILPSYSTEIKLSPPLTEKELEEALTTDEVIEIWHKYMDEKFEK